MTIAQERLYQDSDPDQCQGPPFAETVEKVCQNIFSGIDLQLQLPVE